MYKDDIMDTPGVDRFPVDHAQR